MATAILGPCKNCGGIERYKDGKCKACVLARVKRYGDKHRDRLREYSRNWRLKNIEAVREKDRLRSKEFRSQQPAKRAAIMKAYALRNPAKVANSSKQWKAKNPDLVRMYALARRAKVAGAKGALPRGTFKRMFLAQKGKCICCRASLEAGYHVDHIEPLATGGKHDASNLQLLCPTCNMSKGAKDPIDFMQSRGFLL